MAGLVPTRRSQSAAELPGHAWISTGNAMAAPGHAVRRRRDRVQPTRRGFAACVGRRRWPSLEWPGGFGCVQARGKVLLVFLSDSLWRMLPGFAAIGFTWPAHCGQRRPDGGRDSTGDGELRGSGACVQRLRRRWRRLPPAGRRAGFRDRGSSLRANTLQLPSVVRISRAPTVLACIQVLAPLEPRHLIGVCLQGGALVRACISVVGGEGVHARTVRRVGGLLLLSEVGRGVADVFWECWR